MVKPGEYLVLDRTWKRGDTVDIQFDFVLRFWRGEREYEGKTSIYRGPLLLAYDLIRVIWPLAWISPSMCAKDPLRTKIFSVEAADGWRKVHD